MAAVAIESVAMATFVITTVAMAVRYNNGCTRDIDEKAMCEFKFACFFVIFYL